MNAPARHCKVVEILSGHEFEGLRPTQIARAINTSPANITRDLRFLREMGWVENVANMPDRWRLGPKLIQIARAHDIGMQRVKDRVREIDQRFSRLPA